MAKAVVRHAETGDGNAVAKNLRLADLREVISVTGESPSRGVEAARYLSDECWTVTLEEEPIAMFGYSDSGDGEANVWMLGSDRINDIKWQFLRASKSWLRKIMQNHTRVWAIADVRNGAHKDWYKWLGFSITSTIHVGPYNLPFYHIEYTKEK